MPVWQSSPSWLEERQPPSVVPSAQATEMELQPLSLVLQQVEPAAQRRPRAQKEAAAVSAARQLELALALS